MSEQVNPPTGFTVSEGRCTLPEKIVSKKSNEMWLIHAPKDFPETLLDKIKVDFKNSNSVSEFNIGNKKYTIRGGDQEVLCQTFFCFKDDKKGVIPGKPFVRELFITEVVSTDKAYALTDGAEKDLPEVKQVTGLQLRYIPPGAIMPSVNKKENVTTNKEKPVKKEKTVKKEKKERSRK